MTGIDLVLGVDGGGTKTVAWLARRGGPAGDEPLGIGQAGPGNPRSAGFETALNQIGMAIDAAFQQAGIAPDPVAAACLALAGADRASERSHVERWAAERRLADRVTITNDAEPILAAAAPDHQGVALIAGTGSFAFGRNQVAETARCGGWGFLIGDEGSGYAIALAGLRAAARASDGRGPSTRLVEQLLQRLAVAHPADLVSAIYRADFSRQQLADLSPVVFDAAEQGDAPARQIVTVAARELAELVRTLVRRLRLEPHDYCLALAGGVLLHQTLLRDAVVGELSASACSPGSVVNVPAPVRGAVVLARQAARARDGPPVS